MQFGALFSCVHCTWCGSRQPLLLQSWKLYFAAYNIHTRNYSLANSEIHLDNHSICYELEQKTYRCALAITSYISEFLGSLFTNQNSIQDEIKCRLKAGNSCYCSDQTLLSSRILSKNLKTKIYKTLIIGRINIGRPQTRREDDFREEGTG